MTRYRNPSISDVLGSAKRRSLIKGIGVTLGTVGLVGALPRTARAADPVVIVSWGGTYEVAFNRILSKPFTEQTGIPILLVNGPDLAKAKAQVKTGNIEWDIFDGTGPQITGGETEGLWEPLDTSLIDTSDLALPARKHAVAFMMSVGMIGYAPGRVKGPVPATFAEFWDVEKFPGRRGLRTRVSETLEMALLADGVAPDALYPLDVERAFKSLDRIKSHIAKWIDQTPQTISLLTNNELDFVYTYGARIYAGKKAGLDLAGTTRQTLILGQYMAVLRGSKRRESAMKFIQFILSPEKQAQFASELGHLPSKKSAMSLLSPVAAQSLPDLNDKNNVVISDDWWAKNFIALDRRYKEWLATS